MNLKKINGLDFIFKKIGNINIVFSTANVDLPFNPKLPNFNKNIDILKNSFNLKSIFRGSQTHSNIVYICEEDFKNGIECDGLITNVKNTAVGVFTADCVPILLFDKSKNIISAVHSGWKGVYNEIIVNSINLFYDKFNSKPEDLVIYIGPHNMNCCYEIGDELREQFLNHKTFKNNKNILNKKNLNMIECIKMSILDKGILEKNINTLNYCTYCSENIKFYSYRKNKESLNRMFSFIFID